jgi:hypothetical protein
LAGRNGLKDSETKLVPLYTTGRLCAQEAVMYLNIFSMPLQQQQNQFALEYESSSKGQILHPLRHSAYIGPLGSDMVK